MWVTKAPAECASSRQFPPVPASSRQFNVRRRIVPEESDDWNAFFQADIQSCLKLFRGYMQYQIAFERSVGNPSGFSYHLPDAVEVPIIHHQRTKPSGVGNRCGEAGNGGTAYGRLNDWQLNIQQTRKRGLKSLYAESSLTGSRKLSISLCPTNN